MTKEFDNKYIEVNYILQTLIKNKHLYTNYDLEII